MKLKDIFVPGNTTSFLTGSRVYGTPTDESDIDLVVRMNDGDIEDLKMLCGEDLHEYGGEHCSLHFGTLNLIICADDMRFESWRKGTEELIRRAPVTREEAVEHFQSLFEEEGEI